MTQIQNNEQENLIKFMKQNRPLPPSTNQKIEQQLMKVIKKEKKKYCFSKNLWFWLFPSGIVVGLLLIWGGLMQNNLSPKIANKTEEMESFMVNTWQEAMGEKIDNQQLDNYESSWLLLAEN